MSDHQIELAKNVAANGRLIVVMTFAVILFALWGRGDLPQWPLLFPLAAVCAAYFADLWQSRALGIASICLTSAGIGMGGYLLIGA